MPDDATRDDPENWHRRFAVDANNSAWVLAEKPDLTDAEKSELLDAAHTAAYHWQRIGTEPQIAQAHLLLGRAHAMLGNGSLAMKFASSAYDSITSRESAPWEVAFAHAILADAAVASGNAELHARHYRQAGELGERLDDDERALFHATFDLVPAPDLPGGD
jgi:hypothetical protein